MIIFVNNVVISARMFQIFPDKGCPGAQVVIKTKFVCGQTDRETMTDGHSDKSDQVTPGGPIM